MITTMVIRKKDNTLWKVNNCIKGENKITIELIRENKSVFVSKQTFKRNYMTCDGVAVEVKIKLENHINLTIENGISDLILKGKKPKKAKEKVSWKNIIPKEKNSKNHNRKIKSATKANVLKRDENKCVECGETKNLEIHHIVYRENGGSDNVDNLITLCIQCHMEKHKNEQVYKLMKKRYKTGCKNGN